MIPLGWTLPGAALPDPAAVIDLADCAVVASCAPDATLPQARLAAQVACSRNLEAFLPLRPGSRIRLEQAVDLGRRRGEAIVDRLQSLRGLAQLSVRADWPLSCTDAVTAAGGRAYLEARAARRRAEDIRCREVSEVLQDMVASGATRCEVEREVPGVVQLAGLCRADVVLRTLDGIACMVARGQWPEGTSFSLTGPWPALAFARIFKEAEG